MSEAQLDWIGGHVQGKGDVLEIGTFCGLTTCRLLKCTRGIVFSVDPLDRAPPNHPEARAWIRKLSFLNPDRLVFFPAFSHELIWTRPIDVLFIDGSHQHEHVLADLEHFVPFLKEDGVLILDDWVAVERAFNEFCDKYRLLRADLIPLNTFQKLAAFRNGRPPQHP